MASDENASHGLGSSSDQVLYVNRPIQTEAMGNRGEGREEDDEVEDPVQTLKRPKVCQPLLYRGQVTHTPYEF
jgi:hypothetical protein